MCLRHQRGEITSRFQQLCRKQTTMVPEQEAQVRSGSRSCIWSSTVHQVWSQSEPGRHSWRDDMFPWSAAIKSLWTSMCQEWLFSGNVFAWKNLWRDAGGKEIFWVEGENEFLFRPSHQRWSSVTSLEYWIMIIISRSGSSKVVQSVVRGGGSRFLQPLKVLLAGGHGQSRLSKDKLSAFYSACFDTKSRKVQRQTFERCQWHLKSHSMLTLCWFQGKATFTLCVDVQ